MEKNGAQIKPYYVMDKKGNKTALFVDVAAFKDVVNAFEIMQPVAPATPMPVRTPKYFSPELVFRKGLSSLMGNFKFFRKIF